MPDELAPLHAAIESSQLPRDLSTLVGDIFDRERAIFLVQEGVLHDYKLDIPSDWTSGYGAGIVRLVIAFYNTYGGVILFGIEDITKQVRGTNTYLDIESLNRFVSDLTGHGVECKCKCYELGSGDDDRHVIAVLVPRRVEPFPATLKLDLAKYRAGSIFVRVRHEALTADRSHFSILFSNRTRTGLVTSEAHSTIQRVLPPSFTTMKSFVGRDELLLSLWTWLADDSDPRRYLFGPGGSGKSTLAYEFAESMTNAFGGVTLPNGEVVDYIIYLSAKESEFNVLSGKEQSFALRDFVDAHQQFDSILYNSGFSNDLELSSADSNEKGKLIQALFDSFNGLIILDDIDALSRASKDTGEESLFIKAVKGRKSTRILYTLRSPPSNALSSSINVPGLRFDTEYCEFVETYCQQVGVPVPSARELLDIYHQTADGLPLLVELALGLRRHFSRYADVLEKMREVDGDAVRAYLYRREYDRIQLDRTRLMLALLSMTEGPLDLLTIEKLLGCTSEQVRDSIGETAGIFVRSVEGRGGGVLYEIVDAAKPFVLARNVGLRFLDQLQRKVRFYAQGSSVTAPEERLLLTKFHESARLKRWGEVRIEGDQIAADDVRLANPEIRSFLGQAYAASAGANSERAREHFRAADAMGAKNVHMMRSWYYLECSEPPNYLEARKVCSKVLGDVGFSRRNHAEFYTKLADTFFREARLIGNANIAKSQSNLVRGLSNLNIALVLGRGERELNPQQTLDWMDRVASAFFRGLLFSPESAFKLVREYVDSKYDIDNEALDLLSYYVDGLSVGRRAIDVRELYGITRRHGAEIRKTRGLSVRFANSFSLLERFEAKFDEFSSAEAPA